MSTPWHLWVVSSIGLLWNGFGAYDYLMSQRAPDAYMRSMGMTEAQIAYLAAMPGWMTGVWAVGVWGAVAATLLLLLRRRSAFHLFAISLAALVISLIYQFALTNGAEVMGTQGAIMSAVVLVGAVLFLVYAAAMRKRGVLG